jgi:hypothetical protein
MDLNTQISLPLAHPRSPTHKSQAVGKSNRQHTSNYQNVKAVLSFVYAHKSKPEPNVKNNVH